MKSLKKNFVLSILAVLSILIGSFAGFFISNKFKVYADENDYDLTIEKVLLKKTIDTEIDNSKTYYDINGNVLIINSNENLTDAYELTVLQTITENDNITMINNMQNQYVKVSFIPKGDAEFLNLSVNVTLKNETSTYNISSLEKTQIEQDKIEYSKLFNLQNTYLLDTQQENGIGEKLNEYDAQGLYTFTFIFNIRDNDGNVSTNNQKQVSFNFLNEKFYTNNDSNNFVQPELYNTEVVLNADKTKLSNEQNYFYYTNINQTANTTIYPTIKYDASKYNLSWTRYVYGILTNYSTVLQKGGLGNSKLIVTQTNEQNSNIITTEITDIDVVEYTIDDKTYNNYIVSLSFTDIGEYIYSFDYILNNQNLNTTKDNQIKQENWQIVADSELTIFGYQLQHSVYGNEEVAEKELKFADITNSNNDIINNISNIDNITNIINTGNLKIISTNQAPLFFNYIASIVNDSEKSFYYFFEKSGENFVNGIKKTITSNTRFTDNGLYVARLTFTYPSYISELGLEKTQTFVFEISSNEPKVEINPINKNNEFQAWGKNNYTNNSILVDWSESLKNEFDVKPNIQIYYNNDYSNILNTNNEITNQFDINDYQNGRIVLSNQNSGKYFVKINYGPCTYNTNTKQYDYSASVVYSYIIDNEPIENISFIDNKNDIELLSNTTNNNFKINYNNGSNIKNSGAKISVSYTFMPINDVESSFSTPIQNNDGSISAVANNASIDIINNNLTYNFGDILKNDGLYIFKFVDDAGNETTKYMFKDTTKPNMLQKVGSDDYSFVPTYTSKIDNIVNQDTIIYWGTHKAIQIEKEIFDLIENEYETIQFGDNYFILIKNGDVNIQYRDINGNNHTSTIKNNVSTTIFTKIDGVSNEHLFIISINDEINNSFVGKVEMNLDKSLLKATVSGAPTNNSQIISANSNFETIGNGISERLNDNYVSNKKYLNISWLDGSDDFAISKVECEFYPFTFELLDVNGNLNLNFPYSPTPYKTINLMENTTTEPDGGNIRTRSTTINLSQDSRYGDLSTTQGMYKITRTYLGNTVDDNNRVYYFYIDRNNIVSYEESFNSSNNYIGSNIQISIGDELNRYNFEAQNLLREFVNDYVLKTNKQPVRLIVPAQKYFVSVDNENYLLDNNKNRILIDNQPVKIDVLINNGKININQLNFLIVNDNQETIASNYMLDTAKYSITIYDNAGLSLIEFDGSRENKIFNSIDFKVFVEMSAPKANFVDSQTNITILPTNSNSNLSKNNTDVKLVWNWIETNDLKAKIDQNNLSVVMTLENGQQSTLYQIKNGIEIINLSNSNTVIYRDGNNCYLDLNLFESVITKNCKVEIYLQYESTNPEYYGEYFSSKQTIFFDFEKPKTNYLSLKNNDKYLSSALSAENGEFDDYTSTINFENYAFAIDSNWRLSTPKQNSFWQEGLDNATTNPNDVLNVWYRVYNKYFDQAGQNAQSLTPDDPRYNSSTEAPTRYMFDEILKDNATGKNIYQPIKGNLEDFNFANFANQYVEMIEMDCAGNYRIYTVYVVDQNCNIEYEISGQNNEEITENDIVTKIDYFNNNSININNKYLKINSINNIGSWIDIDILDGTNDEKLIETIKVAPIELNGYYNFESALEIVNNLLSAENNGGRYYKIKLTTALFDNLIINYRTPGQSYDLDFNIMSGTITATINPNKYDKVTYITKLKVYEFDSETASWVNLEYDDVKNHINFEYTDSDPIKVYTFQYNSVNTRNLRFDYEDNFGQTYSINQLLGVTQTYFENMLTFSNDYILNEDYNISTYIDENNSRYSLYKSAEYYTNSSVVTMEYQPKIYSNITVLRNGEVITFEENPIQSRGTIRLSIFRNNDELATDNIYTVFFKDSSNRYYLYNIHHYTKIGDLSFIDNNNNNHQFSESEFDYEPTISTIIYLRYNEYDSDISFPIKTTVTATRTYYDENNVRLVYDYGIIENDFVFEDFGTYVVTAKNSLNSTKVYKFELIKTEATYYSVNANTGDRFVQVSPSQEKYLYRGSYIEHYLSIYPMNIEINQARNLTLKEETSGAEVKTRVYLIEARDSSASSYKKYIALTTITQSSNILNEQMYLNETQISGSNRYLRTNAKSVTLTIPSYFEDVANEIKVSVIYNSTDLGVISHYQSDSTMSLTFTAAGIYNIYISDIAGNKHSFAGTPYYTLSLVNNFVYNLNNERGIYNSVFNSTVSLNVLQTDAFINLTSTTNSNIYNNKFDLKAKLNGEDYTPTYSNGSYIFNSYGTYFVYLKAYINEMTDENLVETTAKFTIINPNEAKYYHEYIGLNGYEVTKIVKNDYDITDIIKGQQNTSTITKLALYGEDGIGGNGTYNITVSAHIDDIIGNREFTYSVWINKDNDILILSSLPEGEQTTKNITLQMNLYQIYSKVGECKIKINGEDYITINSQTATNNEISTYTLSANNRYNVTLETYSGNTILSFVVTKIEPLNTVAIIVIVVAVVAVVGLTLTFVILRKRMRVR